MMCHRRVRLAVFPSQLILGQMREEDCGSGGSRERPLQEVDFGALAFAREREDELRVPAGGGFDVVVGWGGDCGAEGVRGGGVAEAPD